MDGFLISGKEYLRDDLELPKLLEQLHQAKKRPVCLCRRPGQEMYVAKVNEVYIVKRMPGTGSLHAPVCESYEMPLEVSGLGRVTGAIQEHPDEGFTELKFDFSLTKTQGKKAPEPSDDIPDSVKCEGSKLTLRALLHYLWEEAGLNKWSPLESRRTWCAVRKRLLEAAENKVTKGVNLSVQIFIPETFYDTQKEEIQRRRRNYLAKIIATHVTGSRKLMLLVGEVNRQHVPTLANRKLTVKHLFDFPFRMDDEDNAKVIKRFVDDFEYVKIDKKKRAKNEEAGEKTEAFESQEKDDRHLIVIATFSISMHEVAKIEEISFMRVNEHWVPFETNQEKMLIDDLIKAGRKFIKGLRYRVSARSPLASVVLPDTMPRPTAMYIVPADAKDEYLEALEEMMADSHLASWPWNVADGEMPSFPELP